MPTGYTDCIKDGITFENFTMKCARAFGALIMMRDECPDAKIPERFKPSDYHLKEWDKANVEFDKTSYMSVDRAASRAKEEYDEKIINNRQQITKANNLRQDYERMLSQVEKWLPPTPKHQELKNFMTQQISSSMDSDCDTSYYLKIEKLLTGEEWLSLKLHALLKNIDYHKKEYEEEIKRTNGRNEWLSQLRKSLGI